MRGTYSLIVRTSKIQGAIQLDVRSLNSAIAIAATWSQELGREKWHVFLMNERGEKVWQRT